MSDLIDRQAAIDAMLGDKVEITNVIRALGNVGVKIANTGYNRPIIKVLRCRLGFAKAMTCGSHYTEKHTRCRTSTQTMIFTADTQKGEPMDLIERQKGLPKAWQGTGRRDMEKEEVKQNDILRKLFGL